MYIIMHTEHDSRPTPSIESAEDIINNDETLFDLYEMAEHAAKGRKALDANFGGISPTPEGGIPTRDTARKLIGEAMKARMAQEIKELEDKIEEGLIAFQENSTLSQEEKDEVIKAIIDNTVEEVIADDDPEDDPSSGDPDPSDPVTRRMPRVRARARRRRRSPESRAESAREARREAIADRIDSADKITNKKQRAEALAAIARENLVTNEDEGTYVDLGIMAARRIKESTQHGRIRAARLKRTKKTGEVHDIHDALLAEISRANDDNEAGLEAAKHINMPWYRNETLAARHDSVAMRLSVLKDQAETVREGDPSLDEIREDIINLNSYRLKIKELLKGWQSRKPRDEVEKHLAKVFNDDVFIADMGLRRYGEQQRALSELAIQQQSLELANKIKLPRLRRDTINKVNELRARGV